MCGRVGELPLRDGGHVVASAFQGLTLHPELDLGFPKGDEPSKPQVLLFQTNRLPWRLFLLGGHLLLKCTWNYIDAGKFTQRLSSQTSNIGGAQVSW